MPFSLFKRIFSHKGNQHSSGAISPQSKPEERDRERKGPPDGTSDSHSSASDTNNRRSENVFITHIRATDVVSGLPFLPLGFHVVIQVDGMTTKTSRKPVLVDQDSVEWDKEVILPSDRSCPISFNVYASFELGVGLGNGALLLQYETTIGEVVDRNEQLRVQPITNPVQTVDIFPLCSSIKITTERRICNINDFIAKGDLPESDEMNELEQLTDNGHDALLRYRQIQNEADLDDAITYFQCVHDMYPSDHPSRSAALFNLANAKFIHCQVDHLYFDLGAPITLYRDALRLRASGHPDHATTALELSFALLARFRWQGDQVDRTEAKELLSRAMESFPVESYGYRAACLTLEVAEVSASISDPGLSLADGIDPDEELEPAAQPTLWDSATSDPLQPLMPAGPGSLLGRDLDDMQESELIPMLERAVQLAPDGEPLKPMVLDYLATLLLNRFERLGNRADVDRSILLREEAARITPNGDPDRPGWLNNLVCSLLRRFARFGDLGDIERCIVLIEEAICLTPDGDRDKPIMLNNLGTSLTRRFEHLGNQADLNKSISVQEEALRLTPDSHSDHRPDQLSNLGFSLLVRFEHFGNLADLHKSIPILEEAVHISPDNHVEKPTRLNVLGQSLSRRFERLGDVADINKSISMREEALRLTPTNHLNRPGHLSGLVHSLFRRFELLDDLDDLDMSISLCEKALSLTSISPTDQPSILNNLGLALSLRFQRLGDVSDIDRSIYVSGEAIRLTPNNYPGKSDRLSSLGNAFMRRFERLHDPADINKAISAAEEAVHLIPNGHASQPAFLNNLGLALLNRFQRIGDVVDINRSISASAKAVSLVPDGHPSKPGWLNTLGTTYMEHFKRFHDPSYISAAHLHLSTASRTQIGSAYSRFVASRNWIASARMQGDLQALLDAYGTSINLLPQLAWVGLSLSERHRLLLRAADIARDAAAAALEAGRPEMAIEWLEQGRSVVWSQFLQLRTPVDELRVKYPALANQFQQISKELEHASSRDNSPFRSFTDDMVNARGSGTRSLEQEIQRHHDLALQREKLLSRIRSLPGFGHFLLPKTTEQLAALAHSGPVVCLNASQQRCDALIVMSELGSVIPVSLPDVDYQEVEFLQALLRALLQHGRLIISHDEISRLVPSEGNITLPHFLNILVGERGEGGDRAVKPKPQRIEGFTPDELFQVILAYLWRKVVNPVLDALGFSTPPSDDQKKPRIFWCATGPFTFLPIHAAGLYDTVEAGTKLSDFAIPSYIPTLGTLASSARPESTSRSSNIRLVTVPQPLTDGLGVLGSVEEEIDHIKALSAGSPFVTLQNSHGTVEDVMEKMRTADWVHFSCHGVQDPSNPLDSGLGLADGRRLRLSDIIKLSRPQGGLAFLSACQTAQGDEYLQEESVHLAAGMLLAGYGGVIATMWAIMDADAPIVTKDVYERLFEDGRKLPDVTDAAEALHYAVQRLRKSGVSFTSWVPYIHVGR